ncbi:MAG TPA: PfkB family carbohydrate kinase [Gaiellaceae bacterium]|jgi:fructoselysine 6-kinase|nr:PfkB family carbohydrate kinase [Gaiellaceae bacterium]
MRALNGRHRAVICIGDNCLDRYLPPVDRELVGGSCANVSVALASRGVETAYFGAVGRDVEGDRVLATLRKKNVDISRVVRDGALPTAVTEIALATDGERRFVREEYTITDAFSPPADLAEIAVGACHIHATRLPRHLSELWRIAADAGATLSYDFSDHGLGTALADLDVAFVSSPRDEPWRVVSQLHRAGVRCAVVLRGSRGSLASEAGEVIEMSALRAVDVIDTCGAGDAFIGSFLAVRLAGRTLRECMEEGSRAGAAACSFVGAFPQ